MSFKPSITCDRDGCTEAVAANGYDCGPEGWVRLSPGSVSESTKDFCSLDCLAEWAAKQVGKSLVKWSISVSPAAAAAAPAWMPTGSVLEGLDMKPRPWLDFTKPFGCWPENARRPDVGALNGRQG